MAQFTNGINGAFTGKVGSVIGSSWRRINYMRGLSKKSTKAPTLLQLAHQKRFALVVSMLAQLKDLLDFSFNGKQKGRATGLNMAIGHALKNAVRGEYPAFEVDFNKLLLSKGGLETASETDVKAGPGSTLNFAWNPAANYFNSFDDDRVTAVVYSTGEHTYHVAKTTAVRKDGKVTISIPPAFAGSIAHAYLFFSSRDGKRTSDSMHTGQLEL